MKKILKSLGRRLLDFLSFLGFAVLMSFLLGITLGTIIVYVAAVFALGVGLGFLLFYWVVSMKDPIMAFYLISALVMLILLGLWYVAYKRRWRQIKEEEKAEEEERIRVTYTKKGIK